MSDGGVTFSAGSGLANHDLEKPAKTLYVGLKLKPPRGTVAGKRRRTRALLAFRNGTVAKRDDMTDTIKKMVETLKKSVDEIVSADTTDRDTLLAKSFSEFSAALEGEVAKSAEAVPSDPIAAIQDIYTRASRKLTDAGSAVNEDVHALLNKSIALGELAMRAAVNSTVEVVDSERDARGATLVKAAVHGGGDGEILLKTDLPESLAKFATDPAALAEEIMNVGAELMLLAGVPEKALNKALSAGNLAKADGPEDDPSVDEEGVPAEDAEDDDEGDDAPSDPLDVLGRLLAAAMIQLDAIQRSVDGEDEAAPEDEVPAEEEAPAREEPAAEETPAEETPAEEAEEEAAPAEEPAAEEEAPAAESEPKEDEEEETEKAARSKGLRKSHNNEIEKLKAELAKANSKIAELAKKPAAPKGVVALSKAVDTGGSEEIDLKKKAAELEKMSPEQRTRELIKFSHRTTGKPITL